MIPIVNHTVVTLRFCSGLLTIILHIIAGLLVLRAKSKLIRSRAYNGFCWAQNNCVLALLSNPTAKSFLTLFSSFHDLINQLCCHSSNTSLFSPHSTQKKTPQPKNHTTLKPNCFTNMSFKSNWTTRLFERELKIQAYT